MTDELEVVGEFEGRALEVRGRFGPLPELLKPSARYPFQLLAALLDPQF